MHALPCTLTHTQTEHTHTRAAHTLLVSPSSLLAGCLLGGGKKKKKTNQTRLPTKKYSPNKQNKTKNPTRHPNSPQKGIERERSLVK